MRRPLASSTMVPEYIMKSPTSRCETEYVSFEWYTDRQSMEQILWDPVVRQQQVGLQMCFKRHDQLENSNREDKVYNILSGRPSASTGRLVLGHSGSVPVAGSTRGRHIGNPVLATMLGLSVSAVHIGHLRHMIIREYAIKEVVLLIVDFAISSNCRRLYHLRLKFEINPPTRVVDGKPNTSISVKKAAPYTNFTVGIINVGNEPFVDVAQLLENINNASDMFAANEIRVYLLLRHCVTTTMQ